MGEVPQHVMNRMVADIEAMRASIIDAPVVVVGRDEEYEPSSPRLREQMGLDPYPEEDPLDGSVEMR